MKGTSSFNINNIESLVTQYSFDETNGETLFGTPIIDNDMILLDGVDDYVNLGSSLNYISDYFSISFWAEISEYNKWFITNYNGGGYENGDFYIRVNPSGNVVVQIGTSGNYGSQITSNSLVTLNQTNHYVLTYNTSETANNKLKLYINSNEDWIVSQDTGISGNILDTSADLIIGKYVHMSPNGYSNESFGKLSIFNNTLTQSEILNIYNYQS